MKRILNELKIGVTTQKLKESVANQSFNKKRNEFLKSGDSGNAKFMRSGKSGSWRDFLSTVMVEEIEKRHADMMNRFSYKFEYYNKAEK